MQKSYAVPSLLRFLSSSSRINLCAAGIASLPRFSPITTPEPPSATVDAVDVEAMVEDADEAELEAEGFPILKMLIFAGAVFTGTATAEPEAFLKALNFIAGWTVGTDDDGAVGLETVGREVEVEVDPSTVVGGGELEPDADPLGSASASGLGLVFFAVPNDNFKGAAPSSL